MQRDVLVKQRDVLAIQWEVLAKQRDVLAIIRIISSALREGVQKTAKCYTHTTIVK